jgi:cell division protein FtsZ
MIEFPRETQHTIPTSLVKIIGLGGAGANMLDRVALDGLDGAEILALNADVRTLQGSVASERIQLGRNLTKGLGCGGDPDLGKNVTLEAETEIRMAIKGRKIIFLCVGLGGGTGSGGAPMVCRIAREEDAFVVVFATMPFVFEGTRRRQQAQTSLNELAVLSNAMVIFDNNRMGELVVAKQGIHEAFQAGDQMIADSIKAVIRLVTRPGLIHVGLDELMTALRTTRSRCLFGSGVASGKDRATKALANALASPLLDKGALLRETASLLVHICGGSDLTLYEVELLMQKLSKQVPEKAHVLFGAAIDESMHDQLSITLISSLPEEKLQETSAPEEEAEQPIMEPTEGFGFDQAPAEPLPAPIPEPMPVLANFSFDAPAAPTIDEPVAAAEEAPAPPSGMEHVSSIPAPKSAFADVVAPPEVIEPKSASPFAEPIAATPSLPADFTTLIAPKPATIPPPRAATAIPAPRPAGTIPPPRTAPAAAPAPSPAAAAAEEIRQATPGRKPIFGAAVVPPSEPAPATPAPNAAAASPTASADDVAQPEVSKMLEKTRAKLLQDELLLDKEQLGRFTGTDPTIEDGDNLDIPPFLRKKKK